jgi:hypothetical protein
MPTEAKPLFRIDALRPGVANFVLTSDVADAHRNLSHRASLLASKRVESMKESELLSDFISDVFVRLFGYTGQASGGPVYTLKREALVEIDGKFADAAVGRFSTSGDGHHHIALLEGKGPRDPLGRPFARRRLSAVDQALRYAVSLLCDWYLVTNLREIRLHCKVHD